MWLITYISATPFWRLPAQLVSFPVFLSSHRSVNIRSVYLLCSLRNTGRHAARVVPRCRDPVSGVGPGTGPESWPLTGGPKDSAMLKECSTRVHSNSLRVIKHRPSFGSYVTPWKTTYRSPEITTMCGFSLILSCPVVYLHPCPDSPPYVCPT